MPPFTLVQYTYKTSSNAQFQQGRQSVLLTEKKMMTQHTPLDFVHASKYPQQTAEFKHSIIYSHS